MLLLEWARFTRCIAGNSARVESYNMYAYVYVCMHVTYIYNLPYPRELEDMKKNTSNGDLVTPSQYFLFATLKIIMHICHTS